MRVTVGLALPLPRYIPWHRVECLDQKLFVRNGNVLLSIREPRNRRNVGGIRG
jgi:hypothetical protein